MGTVTVDALKPDRLAPFIGTRAKPLSSDNDEPIDILSYLLPNGKVIKDYMSFYSKVLSRNGGVESYHNLLQLLSSSTSMTEVINKIARLDAIIEDCNADIVVPSPETIANALEVLALLPKKFPVPQIYVSDDGEISLEMSRANKKAVLDFDETDTFSYAYFDGNEFVPGKELAKVSLNKLPEDLKKYFQ